MRKLTKWGLHLLLAPTLEKSLFYEIIIKKKLNVETDEQGYMTDLDIDFIKRLLVAALRYVVKHDPGNVNNYRQALLGLLFYGTEEVTRDIRQSLASGDILLPDEEPVEIGKEAQEILDKLVKIKDKDK